MRKLLALFCGALLLCLSAVAEAAGEGREFQMVSSEAVEQAARSFVEGKLAEFNDPRRMEVELTRKPHDLRVPDGEVSFEASAQYGIRFGSTTLVSVMVKLDGAPYRRLQCSYKVHVFDRVVVAAKNLEPRRLLVSDDVRLEERDVGGLSKKYLTDINDAVGHDSNRKIMAGAILTDNMVINPVIFEPGATVYIMAEKNGVRVRSEGIAMERGRVGRMIRVRNVESGKILRGRVIDEATVQVVL